MSSHDSTEAQPRPIYEEQHGSPQVVREVAHATGATALACITIDDPYATPESVRRAVDTLLMDSAQA